MSSSILVTGGTGYIGSHTVVELVNSGRHVVILDNLSNSQPSVVDGLRQICGDRFCFVEADVRAPAALDQIFREHAIAGVIHFAGSKAVGESVRNPLHYFDNNVGGTLVLLQAMERADVRRLVFSSSATVYGDPRSVPVPETAPLQATNPYGQTKLVCEEMLRALQAADARWNMAVLRYFNPVGAHESGLVGDNPVGVPDNLMPYLTQVAAGLRPYLNIYGNDYPTPDGTGVRDYIHVVDLAKGHLAALRYLESDRRNLTVNLGSGCGISVMGMVETFSRVTGQAVPFRISPRRAGDVACCYADARLAQATLGWTAELGVERMCVDAWRWQSTGAKSVERALRTQVRPAPTVDTSASKPGAL